MAEISIVNEFCVGTHLEYDGQRCKITKFPSRSTVVLEALDQTNCDWSTAKITIKELRDYQQHTE